MWRNDFFLTKKACGEILLIILIKIIPLELTHLKWSHAQTLKDWPVVRFRHSCLRHPSPREAALPPRSGYGRAGGLHRGICGAAGFLTSFPSSLV